MSRDWEFDMKLCMKAKEDVLSDVISNIVTDISIHWLQQYAAEKERADKLQEQLKSKIQLLRITDDSREDARSMYKRALEGATQEQERADKAEAREQKLKEAIESEIEHCFSELECFKADRLLKVLHNLYPEEGEVNE
ncbi:MAG: hypothetical protein ACQEXX_01135 [Bacillota bacterium]